MAIQDPSSSGAAARKLSIAPAAVLFRFRLRFAGHAILDAIVSLKTMLVSLVVFGVLISFLAVLTTVAIFRIVRNGVLIKDRSGQDNDEDGRAAAASIFDSEDIIGGSPLHLPKPSGPTGTSFTFHVYAPPSIGKEIPKVDLV